LSFEGCGEAAKNAEYRQSSRLERRQMKPEELVELYKRTAHTIERCITYGGIPEGYGLEYRSNRDSAWRRLGRRLDGNRAWTGQFYRLVELPKPAEPVPYTRGTWPDWRYLKDSLGNAVPFGTIENEGVNVQSRNGDMFFAWSELTSREVGNTCNGPWVKGGVVKGSCAVRIGRRGVSGSDCVRGVRQRRRGAVVCGCRFGLCIECETVCSRVSGCDAADQSLLGSGAAYACVAGGREQDRKSSGGSAQ